MCTLKDKEDLNKSDVYIIPIDVNTGIILDFGTFKYKNSDDKKMLCFLDLDAAKKYINNNNRCCVEFLIYNGNGVLIQEY